MLHRHARLFHAFICFAALCLSTAIALAQSSGINHWDLNVPSSDVDLSPDDRLIALTLDSPSTTHKIGDEIVESLEHWDYRQSAKIGSTLVGNYTYGKAHGSDPVRFTADGMLVIVADPVRIHVVSAANLKPVRVIEPTLPADFVMGAMETSPVGHFAIVAAGKGLSALLFAYDLDTGRLLFEWKPPLSVRSIAW